LAQLNIITRIADENGLTLSNSSTFAQFVQMGTLETINHSITISYAKILA
jgi:hypothetical protein